MSILQKNTLVNGFLCAIRDVDPLVRASALSCLGELCKVLNYRLGNMLTEVCIKRLTEDSHVQVSKKFLFKLNLNASRLSIASHVY